MQQVTLPTFSERQVLCIEQLRQGQAAAIQASSQSAAKAAGRQSGSTNLGACEWQSASCSSQPALLLSLLLQQLLPQCHYPSLVMSRSLGRSWNQIGGEAGRQLHGAPGGSSWRVRRVGGLCWQLRGQQA